MTDKLTPIRGYFKVDKIVDGEVVDTYEDNNTIMARIPQAFAGIASGYHTLNLEEYSIGCISFGTGGTRFDTLQNEVPKEVRNDRTMLFSEFDFWNTPTQIEQSQPTIPDKYKNVYQTSFGVVPKGDIGGNTAFMEAFNVSDEGSTFPHTDWVPDNYRGSPLGVADDRNGVVGAVSLQSNVIFYSVTMGQFAGNSDTDKAVAYTEAGLYLKLGKDVDAVGNPLGTLFSMKTFPPQWKNSTCSLKIEWKLFF